MTFRINYQIIEGSKNSTIVDYKTKAECVNFFNTYIVDLGVELIDIEEIEENEKDDMSSMHNFI